MCVCRRWCPRRAGRPGARGRTARPATRSGSCRPACRLQSHPRPAPTSVSLTTSPCVHWPICLFGVLDSCYSSTISSVCSSGQHPNGELLPAEDRRRTSVSGPQLISPPRYLRIYNIAITISLWLVCIFIPSYYLG